MSDKQRCVILGAGGHGQVVLEAIRSGEVMEVAGFLDPTQALWGTSVERVPVLGDDSQLGRLQDEGVTHFAMGIGAVGVSAARKEAFERGRMRGLEPLTVLHRDAVILAGAQISPGAFIAAGARVAVRVSVGEAAIVNTGAVVDHHCILEDHAHVGPGAVLCGGVRVGSMSHVGAGAVVREGLTIGSSCLVAAGSAVIRDVPASTRVGGVPATPLRGS